MFSKVQQTWENAARFSKATFSAKPSRGSSETTRPSTARTFVRPAATAAAACTAAAQPAAVSDLCGGPSGQTTAATAAAPPGAAAKPLCVRRLRRRLQRRLDVQRLGGGGGGGGSGFGGGGGGRASGTAWRCRRQRRHGGRSEEIDKPVARARGSAKGAGGGRSAASGLGVRLEAAGDHLGLEGEDEVERRRYLRMCAACAWPVHGVCMACEVGAAGGWCEGRTSPILPLFW